MADVMPLYGPGADPVELSVIPDGIVFTTRVRTTRIHRAPNVSVTESHGAFLISTDKDGAPVLIPARHLDPGETAILRQWSSA
jgi:hypothetical protein